MTSEGLLFSELEDIEEGLSKKTKIFFEERVDNHFYKISEPSSSSTPNKKEGNINLEISGLFRADEIMV